MVGTRIHIAHNKLESVPMMKIMNSKCIEKKVTENNDFIIEIPDRIFINGKIRKLFMRGSFGYLCDYDRLINTNRRFDELKFKILRHLSTADVIFGPCFKDFKFIRKTEKRVRENQNNGETRNDYEESTEEVRLRDFHKLLVYPDSEEYRSLGNKLEDFEYYIIRTKPEFSQIIQFMSNLKDFTDEHPEVNKELYYEHTSLILLQYLILCGDNEISENMLLLKNSDEEYTLMFLDRIVNIVGESSLEFPSYVSYFRETTTCEPYDINLEVVDTYTIEEFKEGKAINEELFNLTLKLAEALKHYSEKKIQKR